MREQWGLNRILPSRWNAVEKDAGLCLDRAIGKNDSLLLH